MDRSFDYRWNIGEVDRLKKNTEYVKAVHVLPVDERKKRPGLLVETTDLCHHNVEFYRTEEWPFHPPAIYRVDKHDKTKRDYLDLTNSTDYFAGMLLTNLMLTTLFVGIEEHNPLSSIKKREEGRREGGVVTLP